MKNWSEDIHSEIDKAPSICKNNLDFEVLLEQITKKPKCFLFPLGIPYNYFSLGHDNI